METATVAKAPPVPVRRGNGLSTMMSFGILGAVAGLAFRLYSLEARVMAIEGRPSPPAVATTPPKRRKFVFRPVVSEPEEEEQARDKSPPRVVEHQNEKDDSSEDEQEPS